VPIGWGVMRISLPHSERASLQCHRRVAIWQSEAGALASWFCTVMSSVLVVEPRCFATATFNITRDRTLDGESVLALDGRLGHGNLEPKASLELASFLAWIAGSRRRSK
jgi:hypothetical protein